MLKHLFLAVVIVSVFACFYGLYNLKLEIEPNDCKMTYMFATPQYSRINFSDDTSFSFYGLYYYNEGVMPMDVTKIKLNGAPVIFVPGNGGSYKQVRSLASVALSKRRGSAADIHLDYYTIDFNGELSALYGNYLERQVRYLKTCINVIFKLYKNNKSVERKVVLIGHSMGAIVAQAVLRDLEVYKYINTIISLSSPLNRPILNLDEQIGAFYQKINNYLSKSRPFFKPNNSMNLCSSPLSFFFSSRNNAKDIDPILNNVLMISIGGGSRDLVVPAGLTISKFSDIHSMTSSIPNVWVPCDHLSAVWCLQLVLVINRYIFDISTKDNHNNVHFVNDRSIRKQVALNHFVRPKLLLCNEKNIGQQLQNITIWREESRNQFSKIYKGVKDSFIQLIPLWKYSKDQKLYIEVTQLDCGDILFGCWLKLGINRSMLCNDGLSLSHNFQILPANGKVSRFFAIVDINNLKNTYANWTHIGLLIRAAQKLKAYKIDIYNNAERNIYLEVPRWPTHHKKSVIKATTNGSLYYKISIQGIEESHVTMEFIIQPLTCIGVFNPVVIKMCIPWAPGFTKYKITRGLPSESFYVNIPVVSPTGYNTSSYPVSLEFFLDSSCRYHISYKFAYAATLSRLVQQYYHWLPSHLSAIVLIILKNQMWKFHDCSSTKDAVPYLGYFQYDSFFMIMGCRILSKTLTPNEVFSPIHGLSFHVIIIVHSTAIVISILIVLLIWSFIIFNANGLSKIISWCLSRTVVEPITDALTVLLGAFIAVLATRTCGGLALFVTCILYIFLISNGYNAYIDDWMLRTALYLNKRIRRLSTPQTSLRKISEKNLIQCEGMKNFSFHVTIFILAFVMACLNITQVLAWMKDSSIVRSESDPSLVPPIIVVSSLILLWLLKAPTKVSTFKIGYKIFAVLFYMSAIASIIYCQEALYHLNYIIAFIFILLVIQEILSRTWESCIIKHRKYE